ncbi:putative integral membrane protein [Coniochaeta sp. 2T2.1]|nr:putative integral membrane protein [Coniochaeta sp. 2T2.1]
MMLHSIFAAILVPASLLISTTQAQAGEGLLSSRATPELPVCATKCLIQSANTTKCSLVDNPCICADDHFQEVVTTCVLKGCTIKEALFTKNTTSTACHVPIRDKSRLGINITTILGIITGVFVIMRLAFKALVMQSWAADDWLILLTTTAGAPSTWIGVHGVGANGLGRDVWTLTAPTITAFAKWFYIMAVLYFMHLTLLKMSILFFYLRIFPTPVTRRLLWATVAFNAVLGIIFVFMAIFQCTPISYTWQEWDGEHQGKCINVNSLAWAHAAISVALDLWMLGIPLSQLPGLNLHWKKKIGVALMFCVGTFVTVVSILRLQGLVSFANSTNPTWDNWEVTNWSFIEINVGIMCACMPTFRLMLVRAFPVLGGGSSGGGTGGPYYYGQRKSGHSRLPRSGNRSAAVGGAGGAGTADDAFKDKKSGAIVYQKSFTVQYGEEQDEVSLVRMGELDGQGRGTGARSEARSRSEVSL